MQTKTHIYLMEFKVNESAEASIKQIREKKYYEKYLSSQKIILLLGISCKEKSIKKWKMKAA